MRNNGHCTFQDHSRSQLLVPIESQYATSYYWIIVTYILSRTVLRYRRLLVKFSVSTVASLFEALVQVESLNSGLRNFA